MIPQLTDEENREWESEKYSDRTLSVRVLSSGMVIVCQGAYYQIVGTFSPDFLTEHPDALYNYMKGLCSRPLPEYRPPSARRLDPSLSPSDLKSVDDLLSDYTLNI